MTNRGRQLLRFALQRVIPAEAVEAYFDGFMAISDKTVISLDTSAVV